HPAHAAGPFPCLLAAPHAAVGAAGKPPRRAAPPQLPGRGARRGGTGRGAGRRGALAKPRLRGRHADPPPAPPLDRTNDRVSDSAPRQAPRSANGRACNLYKNLYSYRMRKGLSFRGSALDDLRAFPLSARREAGYQLDKVQNGERPSDWKPLATVGRGVQEI